MQTMHFTVMGGDKRLPYTAEALRLAGHTVTELSGDIHETPQTALLILPVPLTRDGETVFAPAADKPMPLRTLAETLPELAAEHPAAYRGMGLRDLGERMFDYLRRERPDERLGAAFRELPTPAMTPRAAFSRIVTGDVEMVPTEKLAGRIPANSLIPYPPGIPLLISGERFGGDDSPHLAYLRALAAWDRAFPGFEHVTEGVEIVDGVYRVMCVKE